MHGMEPHDEIEYWRDRARKSERAAQQRDTALSMLSLVMDSLAHSAGSPDEQALYASARALLAEHGLRGLPAELVEAYERWEAAR